MTDVQTSFPLLIVWPSILNLVINFSTHLWPGEMKCPIGYTFALRIPFYLLQYWSNTCTNHITNDMIHFISSCDLVGSSILTSLAFHRCLRPSVPSLAQVSLPHGPSLQSLQLVHQAKSCLNLVHLSHMTQCHVSYAMSSFITCVSLATYPSYFTSMA